MNASENETHDDIIAEMRIFKCRNLKTLELENCESIQQYLANRLVAAHKREVDALKERVKQLEEENELQGEKITGLLKNANKEVVSDMFFFRQKAKDLLKIIEWGLRLQEKLGIGGKGLDTDKIDNAVDCLIEGIKKR